MSNKRSNIKTNNLVQLFLLLAAIAFINIIGTYLYTRWDLTSEKRYSLAPATQDMLHKLDDVVFFKVYLEGEFPAGFKRLRNETKEMLDEFRAYSKNIQYEFINLNDLTSTKARKTEQEDLIRRGLQPTDLTVQKEDGMSKQVIFPGAIVSYKSNEIPLSLLLNQLNTPPQEVLNNSIKALEYNLASAIRKLSTPSKPNIAFIEGHGELKPIEVADISIALSDFYTIERIAINEQITALTRRDTTKKGNVIFRNKYQALIIAQPQTAFSEKDKFIIDQFIMRGGKVMWFIDPVAASMDSLQGTPNTVAISRELNLNDMLFKYGARLNNNLLMDLNALPIPVVTGNIGNKPQQSFLPWEFFPIITPTQKHPIVNNLNALRTNFISSIDTVRAPGITKTILLTTSQYTRKVDAPTLISLDILGQKPNYRKYRDAYQPVALLLEGRFESLFKNRITHDLAQNNLIGFIEIADTAGKMLLVSDGDIIRNQLHYSKGYALPLEMDQFTGQTFGNKDFILNAINYLCDDTGLMQVRSRDIKLRLLNKTKLEEEKLSWQLLNTVVPVLIILLFGLIRHFIRRRKYTK